MRARLKVSRAGVELIKSFEGLRPTAAKLPDGRWTLGYGHTLSAREGAQVTADDAEALLRFDLLPVVDAVNTLVTVPLNQNQFDAMVSFCFNIGVDNFKSSLVLKRLNEGQMAEAALAMDSWRSAEYNGETYVLAPLIRRRTAEKSLFATPVEAVAPVSDTSALDEAQRLAEEAEKKRQASEREQAAQVEAARAQAEAEAAQRRADEDSRLREEAAKQAEALAAARLAAEAAAAEAAQKLAQAAAAKAAEEKRIAEEKQQAEQVRLAEEHRLAQEATEKNAVTQPQLQPDEEAEKARKAEAAAALMRLYSPYGGGVRGSLAAPPKPIATTSASTPVKPVTPVAPAALSTPEPDLTPARPALTPPVSASNMPAPVVSVLSSFAAAAAVAPVADSVLHPQARAGFEPQPEAEPVFHVEPTPEVAVTPEPVITEAPQTEPVVSAPVVAPTVVPGLHWREQLKRPLPQDYQPQDYQPIAPSPAYETPVEPQPAHDFMQTPSGTASSFTETYAEAPEDWMLDGGRIALSSEEMEEEGVSWWKMIVSTLNWILLSCFGLACLGVASAAWWMGRNDPAVARLGHMQNYTTVSIITAIAGILFVSISVWLIMKRLGGLKD